MKIINLACRYLALVMLISSSHVLASNQEVQFPEAMHPWRVGIIVPSFYPVKVSNMYAVYEKEDLTVQMINFLMLMGRSDLTNIRTMIPDYDGFGLPLLTGAASIVQIGNHKKLPDSIYIYWVSLFNQRFFAIKYDIPDQFRKQALVKRQLKDSTQFECYENFIYFGLLPNGHAKVWQGGCGYFTLIEEVPPTLEKQHDIDGFDAQVYVDSYQKDIQQRAQAEGVTLDPIPWDKLNRTFTYDRQKAMDAYLERMKAKVHQPKAASSQP